MLGIPSLAEREIVLFLGAGFSRAAGLPLMKEFADETAIEIAALTERHGTLDRTQSGYRYAAAKLLEAAHTYLDFRNLCRSRTTGASLEWDNLESLYCVAEAMSEAETGEIDLNGQAHSITSVVRDIQLWVWKVYQRMPVLQSEPLTKVDQTVHPSFSEFVRNRGINHRLVVLTTNYDLVYEYHSAKYHMPCSYPVTWPDGFSVNRTPAPYVFRPGERDQATLVCKLHGSVNYFENSELPGADGSKLFVAPDLGGGPTVGKSGSAAGWPALLALDAIWVLEKRYGPMLTPAIVPPTYAKLVRKPWLRRIWHTALHCLSQARIAVFIGYSMPQSDGFMSAFLSAARVQGAKASPAVFVLDPCQDAFERIVDVYGPASCKWIAGNLGPETISQLDKLLDAVDLRPTQ